jgi:hypothetical protein
LLAQGAYEVSALEAAARLFLSGGLGATHYSEVVLPVGALPGKTRFSWAFGGGLKVYPSQHLGFKAMLRFVPTYTEAWESGLWCEPITPSCGANSGAQNSIQVEFSVGLAIRF